MFESKILLAKEPQKNRSPIFIIVISILFIVLLNIKTYDKYSTVSYKMSDQDLKVLVPENFTINEKTIIEYQNKTYPIKEIKYLSSYIEDKIIFKELLITSDIQNTEEIMTINFLSNKQRILKKILNIVKEN